MVDETLQCPDVEGVTLTEPAEAAVSFNLEGLEVPVLEIRSNGDFMVRGKPVVNDIEIYHALKDFLAGVIR